jgi:lipoprotein-anchoring transpeptidase ErfK/SrfK
MPRGVRLLASRTAATILAAAALSFPATATADPRASAGFAFVPVRLVDLTVPHRIAPTARRPQAGRTRPEPAVLVRISSSRPITARPGGGRTVGLMPSSSKYLHQPMVAWVLESTPNRRFGKVTLPFSGRSAATGWISLAGGARTHTPFSVHVDLSKHQVTLLRLGKVVFRTPAATGAPVSPTPPGRYFVTDRVAVGAGSSFGSFAFGISGLQTHLPPGWGGGDQLAIHGTNSPSTIGTSSSAGCVRVSEAALARLKPVLQLGTPVVIEP